MSILHMASELARTKNISAIVTNAKALSNVKASKEQAKAAIDALTIHLKCNRHHQAVAIAVVLLVWDADSTVARLRRGGVLRASRYEFRSKALIKVLDSALEIVPQLELRPDRLQYLHSVRALLTVAPEARRIHKALLARLVVHKKNALKTLLVFVNELFVNNWQANWDADSSQLNYWGAEDLALAFSYILNLMRKDVGHGFKSWQHVDDRLVSPFEKIYGGMLIDAAKLNEFREIETLIDGMPYEVAGNGKRLEIFSTDESFEQSVRLGYIQADIQVAIRAIGIAGEFKGPENKSIPTIEEFIQAAFDAGMDELIETIPHPVERLVFKIPMEPAFFEPIAAERYFATEIAALIGAAIEGFNPEGGDVCDMRVSENLTTADIVKIQRLFGVISAAFNEGLRKIEDQSRQNLLRIRSVIPIVQHDFLLQAMEMILPKSKALEALQLLTLHEDQDYIDLQYKPIIKAGDYYVIAPALVYKSNLLRNIVVANKLRNKLVGIKDPMQDAVVEALVSAGFVVKSGFTFDINGKRETDIFCWLGGNLFIFECKNSFHPCSAHELRTSYEHIKEAEQQLDIRRNWLQVPANQEKLLRGLGWKVQPTDKIHTGIVTANRLFTGYQKGRHPIRQAFELINVLQSGLIGRGEEAPLRFWKGSTFCVDDLVDYLQGKNIVQMQFDQLQPFIREFRLGESSLKFRTYRMNIAGMVRDAEAAYMPVTEDVDG